MSHGGGRRRVRGQLGEEQSCQERTQTPFSRVILLRESNIFNVGSCHVAHLFEDVLLDVVGLRPVSALGARGRGKGAVALDHASDAGNLKKHTR